MQGLIFTWLGSIYIRKIFHAKTESTFFQLWSEMWMILLQILLFNTGIEDLQQYYKSPRLYFGTTDLWNKIKVIIWNKQ
jgi:hypothetical protein